MTNSTKHQKMEKLDCLQSFVFGVYTQDLATVLTEGGSERGYVDLQKAQEAFWEQQGTSAKNISETTKSNKRLTGRHIVQLGKHIISDEDLGTLAQKYLNISHEKVKNIQYKSTYSEARRSVVRHWARKNPGPDQITVPKTLFVHFQENVVI